LLVQEAIVGPCLNGRQHPLAPFYDAGHREQAELTKITLLAQWGVIALR
jgi:hypothetical protein